MNIHTRQVTGVLMAIVVLTLSMNSAAGSNLTGGYPDPACGERPEVPARPERFETEEAIAEYNAKVEAYNASMEGLVTCVREYVANAAADIEQIRKRSREAIDRLDQ